VDVVSLAHEFTTERPFDVVLSTEMLEHDPHWQASVRRMSEVVRPGGSVFVTCAGPGRPAHEVDCAPPFDSAQGARHYQGVSAGQIVAEAQGCDQWRRIYAEEHTAPNDSYVALVCEEAGRRPVVSVIIPAVGNVELTRRCVQSVRKFANLPVEIVLVENGSKPTNREALADLDAEVFLSYDRMIGYPAAINRGAAAARGEYLCLLNNDTEMTQPGWDAQLVFTLQTTGAAVVSPVVDFVANPAQRADAAQPARAPFEAAELFFVCVLLRRDLFAELGALDEGFGLGNCEDKDFCRRAVQAGGRLVIEPAVFVRHAGNSTFRRLPGVMFPALLKQNEQRLAGMSYG
jgi:GT2 family glycosyltransferase